MKVEAAMRNILRIVAFVSFAAMLACASGSAKKPDKGGGFRVLDAVVVERESHAGYGGAMVYSIGFEAKDGEAIAHMRYEVTKDQYFRYQEGARVRLYLANDRLRDIKPGD
jgi:hypothetical protein